MASLLHLDTTHGRRQDIPNDVKDRIKKYFKAGQAAQEHWKSFLFP